MRWSRNSLAPFTKHRIIASPKLIRPTTDDDCSFPREYSPSPRASEAITAYINRAEAHVNGDNGTHDCSERDEK
jgi:hypothetical protein